MTFILQVDPSTLSTAQQKGERVVGKFIHHYVKPQVRRSQEALRRAFLLEWKERVGGKTKMVKTKRGKWLSAASSDIPYKEPLYMNLTFAFPFTKNTPKRVREADYPVPMVERPDIDNIVKGTLDAMVAVRIIPDDSQIVSLAVLKVRQTRPCIIVSLWTQHEMDAVRFSCSEFSSKGNEAEERCDW